MNNCRNWSWTKLLICLFVLVSYFGHCYCQFPDDNDRDDSFSKKHEFNSRNSKLPLHKRFSREKEKKQNMIVRQIILASKDDNCDWKTKPMAFLSGELCGAYYKVLGLERKRLQQGDISSQFSENSGIDKGEIKRAYRIKSLSVHPDKNSAPDANVAFNIVQTAYECLSEDICRYRYDMDLDIAEHNLLAQREEMKQVMTTKALEVFGHTHYFVSVAAHHAYQFSRDIWALLGQLNMNVLGGEFPMGRVLVMSLLALKARYILYLYSIAYGIVRINYEIAKAKGLF